MSKLPQYYYKDLVKKLKKAGFEFDRQAKGSHEIWFNPSSRLRTVVPNHPTPLSKGTLRAIIRQMNITTQEFQDL